MIRQASSFHEIIPAGFGFFPDRSLAKYEVSRSQMVCPPKKYVLLHFFLAFLGDDIYIGN
jgi:hypothetical protein